KAVLCTACSVKHRSPSQSPCSWAMTRSRDPRQAQHLLTDDRVIGCAFSFARSRVRAFNGSMFWLGQRAARARLDGGERRGHMQPNTPRRKNARTRERVNAEAAG